MTRWLFATVLVQIAAPQVMAADPPTRTIAPPTRIPDPSPALTPAGEPVSTSTMPEQVRRAVVDDAARRFKVSPNDVVLTRAEKVIWPDGSLGCPQPGRSYTQMLVHGFRVVAKTPSGELLYHTNDRASAVNCAGSFVPRSLQKRDKPLESVTAPGTPANPNL